jgi:conjugal transfer/type IV secretion protein DotA/TraY
MRIYIRVPAAIVGLTLIALTGSARAQTSLGVGYGEVVEAGRQIGDKAGELLTNLFSDFAQNPFSQTGGPNTLLGNLFFIFNSGLFVIGTALLTYYLLATVAQTAHEGEVLGKRINGLWVPIRVTFGVFGMLPVFGGFSLAQAILMWSVILGIGLANLLTTKAIEQTNQFEALIPPPGIAASGTETTFSADFAKNLFFMNVCAEAAGRYHQEATRTFTSFGQPQIRLIPRSSETRIETVGIPGSNDCGSLVLKGNDARENGVLEVGWRSVAVDYESIKEISDTSFSAKSDALIALQSQMNAEAKKLVNAYYDDTENQGQNYSLDTKLFDETAAQANARVRAAAENAIASKDLTALNENTREVIGKGGWITLGSWHSTYAEVQAAMQTASFNGQLIIESPVKIDTRSSAQNGTLRRLVQVAEAYVDRPRQDTSADSLESDSPGRWIFEKAFLAAADGTAGKGMVNPITTAKNAGDTMITASLSMYALYVGLNSIPMVDKLGSVGASVISAIPGIGIFGTMLAKIIGGAAAFLPYLATAMIIIGVMLSIYVPMIPFLTWAAALVSYFASVIEGLVGAQVWAFSHLNLEGDGMGARAERGYTYLLNMLLRPALMVLGFFFASALLILVGTFVIGEIRTVVENVQGNSMTGLISIFGFMIIFAVLLFTLTSTCFDLIFELPDRVIGAIGDRMDASMSKGATRQIEGLMSNASRWAGVSAGAAVGNASAKDIQKGLKK